MCMCIVAFFTLCDDWGLRVLFFSLLFSFPFKDENKDCVRFYFSFFLFITMSTQEVSLDFVLGGGGQEQETGCRGARAELTRVSR